MSELKLIVDQAIEELGGWNDAAIDYWSKISGVDIRSIDENTPFDIEVANRLLATFPEVLQKFKEGAFEGKAEEKPEEVMEGLEEAAQELLGGLEEAEAPAEAEAQAEEPEVEEVLEEVAEMAEELASAMGEEVVVEEAPEAEEEEALEELPEEEVAPEVVEELAEAAKVMESLELPAVNLEPFRGMPGAVGACAFYQGKLVAKEAFGEVELDALEELLAGATELFRKLLGKGERKFDSLVLSLGNMHVLAMPKGEFYFAAVMKAERLGAALAFFREALKRVEA